MSETKKTVIFIHGLWLHATSWDAWTTLFEDAGYTSMAPGWPGDPDTRRSGTPNPDSIADHGIDDVVEHYAAIIDSLPELPILIGHSFGGMIAEKLLGMDLARAPSPSTPRRSRACFRCRCPRCAPPCPVFKNPANKHRAVSLTAEQFRYAFGNALTEEESNDLYDQWTIPAPGEPLFEAAAANFYPALARGQGRHRQRGPGPLLLIMGGQDHTVPGSRHRSRPSSSTATPTRSPTSSSSPIAATP